MKCVNDYRISIANHRMDRGQLEESGRWDIYIQFQEKPRERSTEYEKSLANQRLTHYIQHQRPERDISKTTKKNWHGFTYYSLSRGRNDRDKGHHEVNGSDDDGNLTLEGGPASLRKARVRAWRRNKFGTGSRRRQWCYECGVEPRLNFNITSITSLSPAAKWEKVRK